MITPVYIEDIIGQIVASVTSQMLSTIKANETAVLGQTSITTINYQYGPGTELIETLQQLDNSQSLQVTKYPLIWLVTDITEKRGKQAGIFATENITVFIMHQTDRNYKTYERATNVFKPVLDPLYYSFIYQCSKHPMVNNGPEDMIQHDRTKRYFIGSKDNKGMALTDFVDAIEISNLNLLIDYNQCS